VASGRAPGGSQKGDTAGHLDGRTKNVRAQVYIFSFHVHNLQYSQNCQVWLVILIEVFEKAAVVLLIYDPEKEVACRRERPRATQKRFVA
jgi:hypothetical protein